MTEYEKNIHCKVCGIELHTLKKWPQKCKEFCCGHCPDRKKSPCEKEEKFGGFFSSL